jgi:hypothetical protein
LEVELHFSHSFYKLVRMEWGEVLYRWILACFLNLASS